MFATDFEGWEKGVNKPCRNLLSPSLCSGDKFRWQMSALGLGVFMADADLWKYGGFFFGLLLHSNHEQQGSTAK